MHFYFKFQTLICIAFTVKVVLSMEEGTSISVLMVEAVCNHYQRLYLTGLDEPITRPTSLTGSGRSYVVSTPQGKFVKNSCEEDESCEVVFSLLVEHYAQPLTVYIEPEIGPQSQVKLEITRTMTFGKHIYVHVTRPELSFPMALNACASNGMVLASISRTQDRFHIQELVESSVSSEYVAEVWVGATRFTADPEGKRYEWLYGTREIDPDLWERGRIPQGEAEDCIVFRNSQDRYLYRLKDRHCKTRLSFICQSML